jgi:hypothetical protein
MWFMPCRISPFLKCGICRFLERETPHIASWLTSIQNGWNRHRSRDTSLNRSSKIAQMLQAHLPNAVSLEIWMCKVNVKQSHNTSMKAQGERMHSSYSFTTWALDGGEWSASRPGSSLPPGKGPTVPIVQEAGWAPEPIWTQRLEEKSSLPLLGIEPQSSGRPVRRHYTGWATPVSWECVKDS